MYLLVRCKSHPERMITNVFIRKECPLQSRLACNKCLHENQQQFENFLDFGDFIEDPVNMLTVNNRNLGIFDDLNYYFNRAQKDPKVILEEYQQKINQLMNQLQQDLAKEIEQFRQFQNMIKQAKTQFIEAVKHKKLIDNFKQLITIDKYYQKQEWTKLEEGLAEYIQQFINQENQELKQTLYQLKENDKDYFSDQIFSEVKKQAQTLFNDLTSEFQKITNQFSLIQENLKGDFHVQLLQKIDPNKKTKASLLFKGSEDGMTSKAFWNKCQNQGPTLVICRSSLDMVFGGYSPCKWIPNSSYQSDASSKSFLFNSNRKEIYPNVNQSNQIYGRADYGPTFGSGHDLYIGGTDFNTGSSALGTSFKVENQNAIPNYNAATYLMGSTKPDLVEMEVFLIKEIK